MHFEPHYEITYPETFFTPREIEILLLIAKGMQTKEIAENLKIAEHTVRTHRKNILEKAGCKNSTELVKKAFENGLFSRDLIDFFSSK